MDLLKSIFAPANPDPEFAGQCIQSATSGIPLVAVRVHPKYGQSYLAWRAAEVRCGFAMDGGLQQLIETLKGRTTSDSKKIFVDPAVYKQSDLMGAMAAIAGPDYKFVSTDYEEPCVGCIHVAKPLPNMPIVELFQAAPTVTKNGTVLGVKPEATTVPVAATAATVTQALNDEKKAEETGAPLTGLAATLATGRKLLKSVTGARDTSAPNVDMYRREKRWIPSQAGKDEDYSKFQFPSTTVPPTPAEAADQQRLAQYRARQAELQKARLEGFQRDFPNYTRPAAAAVGGGRRRKSSKRRRKSTKRRSGRKH